jgi:hypothetical protein
MLSLFWSLLAAFCAVGSEYLYRTLPGPWIRDLPLYLPIQVVICLCIYKLVTTPGQPLLGALILWSFATITTRVFVSTVLLHDKVPVGTWVAVALMVAARFSQQIWK